MKNPSYPGSDNGCRPQTCPAGLEVGNRPAWGPGSVEEPARFYVPTYFKPTNGPGTKAQEQHYGLCSRTQGGVRRSVTVTEHTQDG